MNPHRRLPLAGATGAIYARSRLHPVHADNVDDAWDGAPSQESRPSPPAARRSPACSPARSGGCARATPPASPRGDYVALLGVLRRSLTPQEVRAIAAERAQGPRCASLPAMLACALLLGRRGEAPS